MAFDLKLPSPPCDAKPEVKAALQDLTTFCDFLAKDGPLNEAAMTYVLMLAHGLIETKWSMDDKVSQSIKKLVNGECKKKARGIQAVHANIINNVESMRKMKPCKVCEYPVDKAHQCVECRAYVHSIKCSVPQGEEGHGQKVLCHLCSPLGKKDNSDAPPKPPDSEDHRGAPEKKDIVDAPPKQDVEASRSIEKIQELVSFCSAQAPEIKECCDEAVKLGKRLAVGIAGEHWLLLEATSNQIDILLCTPTEKRPSFMKTIITTTISALEKNITAMERVSFCPICLKPAPKNNACDSCKQPAHLNCGGRLEGPEFYCNHCRSKEMAADGLAGLKDSTGNPSTTPPSTTNNPGDENIPPGNIPGNANGTTNIPDDENIPPGNIPGNANGTTDNTGNANTNQGVTELYDPAIFYEAFSVEDEDGKWKLDLDKILLEVTDSEGMEEWHDFIQGRFKDSDKKATPEDWANLFSLALSTDVVPSDSFDSEHGALSTIQKSGLTQMAFLMACTAPSRFGNELYFYEKATRGYVLAETIATVIWRGAVQTLGSPWIGIRSLQQNWHNFVYRKKVADEQIQGLLTVGNEAKLIRVDRILSTLDQTTEYLRCLGVCEIWAEMVEKSRIELLMPWGDGLREKWCPLEVGFPKVNTPNPQHCITLSQLWEDRETLSTLPLHMRNAARNKPKIGWKRFYSLWLKGRQLASDIWYTSPGMSKEAIFDKMTSEFGDTTSGPTLTAASDAYRLRFLNLHKASLKQEEANKRAQAVELEEKELEETIQQTQQELAEAKKTKSSLPTVQTRSTRSSVSTTEASQRLAELQKQKEEKENDRKRSLEEAKEAKLEMEEAAKKIVAEPKSKKKAKTQHTSLVEMAGDGSPDTAPPVRRGTRLAYDEPGKLWKEAAITIASMLAIIHDVIKSECECMTLSRSDLDAIRNKQTNELKLADFQVYINEVKKFKNKNKREPNSEEMAGIIESGNTQKPLDKLLKDKFVRKAIINLEMLDLSEFVDMDTGDTINKNIKVKNLRPSLLSWMTLTETAELCWHLKCIEHVKKEKKVRELRVLIRQKFGSGFKDEMLSLLDAIVKNKKK